MSQILSKKTYNFCVLLYLLIFGLSLYFYYPYFLEIEYNLYFIFEVFWKSLYINMSFLALIILIIKYEYLTLPKEKISNIGNENAGKFLFTFGNLLIIFNYVGIILGLILNLFIMFIGGIISIIFSSIMMGKERKKKKLYGLMLIGLVEMIAFIIYLF